MEKIFENVSEIKTIEDYEIVWSRVKELIAEATKNGALDNPEADNEYTREIGRLSILGAEYETNYMEFKYLKVRKKSPPSMRTAKKPHKSLNIDAELLIEYA